MTISLISFAESPSLQSPVKVAEGEKKGGTRTRGEEMIGDVDKLGSISGKGLDQSTLVGVPVQLRRKSKKQGNRG